MGTPLQCQQGAAPAQGVADKIEGRDGKALQLLKLTAAALVCVTLQDAAFPADLHHSLPLILLGGLPRDDFAGKALASLLYWEAHDLFEQASLAAILNCHERFRQKDPVSRRPLTAALKHMLKRVGSSTRSAHLVPALDHLGKCAMSHSSAGLIHICKASLSIVLQDCLSCLEGSSLLLLRAASMDLMPFEARAAASHTLL